MSVTWLVDDVALFPDPEGMVSDAEESLPEDDVSDPELLFSSVPSLVVVVFPEDVDPVVVLGSLVVPEDVDPVVVLVSLVAPVVVVPVVVFALLVVPVVVAPVVVLGSRVVPEAAVPVVVFALLVVPSVVVSAEGSELLAPVVAVPLSDRLVSVTFVPEDSFVSERDRHIIPTD